MDTKPTAEHVAALYSDDYQKLTAERDTLKALCVEQSKALGRIKSLLDGADKWSDWDIRANANCAYSVAEDAIEGARSILK